MNEESKKEFIHSLKRDIYGYEYIPNELSLYLVNAFKNNINDELVSALSGPGKDRVLNNINNMFLTACKTCNMTLPDLVQKLGFHPNDVGEGRLSAFFANIRMVNLLAIWNFKNIRPLPTKNETKADLFCEYKGVRCVVEVFCSPRKYFRYPGHTIKSIDLREYYISRALDKKKQLEVTSEELGCNKKLLALVFDSLEAQATLVHHDFELLLKEIYDVLKWGTDYHFILSTGMESDVPDDAIYPPLW